MAAYPSFEISKEIMNEKHLRNLAYGLVMSGFAMSISGTSRPASGAEHLISHAIDELNPGMSIHGIQVAYGCQLIEQKITGKTKYQKFFENIGMNKILEKDFFYNDKQIEKIFLKAKKIRNRYTILNKYLKKRY